MLSKFRNKPWCWYIVALKPYVASRDGVLFFRQRFKPCLEIITFLISKVRHNSVVHPFKSTAVKADREIRKQNKTLHCSKLWFLSFENMFSLKITRPARCFYGLQTSLINSSCFSSSAALYQRYLYHFMSIQLTSLEMGPFKLISVAFKGANINPAMCVDLDPPLCWGFQ